MSSDPKKPVIARPEGDNELAKPVAERKPGESAKPSNNVTAKDAFGAPRNDPEWTREAMEAKMRKPGFEGTEDKVHEEQAKDLKN
ncbi:MAG: hypothetical protein AAFN80_08800 [Pseudomonadota bacterium]